MMKLNEFLDKLELAYDTPNYYLSGGWGKWNGAKWGWDCVCLIKGILWGWNNDKTKPRGGGAVYGSNGVPDIGTEQMINYCGNVSTDFSKIAVGELVWMQGHVGIYIGDGKVMECTAGWATWKIIKSDIDSKGNRTYNGNGLSAPWKKHGFLPYVDYETTIPTSEPTVPEEPEEPKEPEAPDTTEPVNITLPGDVVEVNGRGFAASDGTGAATRLYKKAPMKVIYINEGAEYPYALNQYGEGEIGDMTAVTAWFKESDIERR